MPDTGAIPFIIAQEMGLFEGLNLDITLFTSAPNRDAALTAGSLDGAMVDMLAMIFYAEGGFPVKITSQTRSDFQLILSPTLIAELGNPTTQADLFTALTTHKESLSVGISKHTVIDFATSTLGYVTGIPLTPVTVPQIPVRLEMLQSGALAAATLPDPLATLAVLSGGVSLVGTQGIELEPGVLVLSQELIDKNPAAVEELYRGYNRAVDYIQSTPEEEYYDLIAERLKFPPRVKGFIELPTFTYAEPPQEATFYAVMEWALENNLSTSNYQLEDLTAEHILPLP